MDVDFTNYAEFAQSPLRAPNRAGGSGRDPLPHSSGNFEFGCGDVDISIYITLAIIPYFMSVACNTKWKVLVEC